ncbi:MAG: ferric iron uptake transcriptional regulator [Thalassobium sp.]|jgi:Fur family ferric uptake transcriptional regulator|uniref:Ferric uptake regulation protein n=1 Tax=Thalassolituus pacificus TaxID=2975440 RepID=A0A9X2WE66_9GAMM|nr:MULTISPECIES: ferric iron uptake transcriptional regulator [Thalassolituus]MBU2039453.1 ferric iron uptake transcriptional regulator [Gammaproteobacteria bacterium]PHS63544.1 MAG: ferric iron uptake transcriptional regulator [Thalassobium sp.]PIQ39662.1 MAG: ferric iron uptake transcriptional regulator [Thalassolituus sp. CG17_big_fil_post_rev_8_21_14_2_50_53_8]MCA6061691.1 ferric iron uptake transcriptional regulator [Thalassolituus sp. ST750PaO-4]MCB2386344.1 ferric iron uptake transcript|tara:strand:+ start:738 stop:1145 length:408 start_codon:yes stop_codon:yes gene_type:complete
MSDQNVELRKAGLKVTLPRVKILSILETNIDAHMSAEDVYKSLIEAGEDVGLATVYRVLTQFESAGLVTRHNFDGGHSVFELARGEHHDHMVNVDDGTVIEFTNAQIERLQHEIAEEHGFDLVEHSLVLYVRKKK